MRRPVMVVHGDMDTAVPVSLSSRRSKTVKSSSTRSVHARSTRPSRSYRLWRCRITRYTVLMGPPSKSRSADISPDAGYGGGLILV